MEGKVYLVGAGPGDPGLLNIRALGVLRKADVVAYDRLVSKRILRLAPKSARKIYVGKEKERHSLSQVEINKLLVEEAMKGNVVVRLKGGDPFLFGRGGEEAEWLSESGVPFEVVPGVTSALSVPTCAGIPLTHRKYSSSLAIVTGHEDPTKPEARVKWEQLAKAVDTIVVLMGVRRLGAIVDRLIEGGRDPNTPVAVIERGTTEGLRTIIGALSNIVEKVREAKVGPPSVIVIGDVVKFHKKLTWLGKNPLRGKVVAITRPKSLARELVELLAERGARPLVVPTIEIKPAENREPLKKLVEDIIQGEVTYIVFMSLNGIRALFNIAEELAVKDELVLSVNKTTVVAIGPKTAQGLRKYGVKVDLVPRKYSSEGLVEELGKCDLGGKVVALIRAKGVTSLLSDRLGNMGAKVTTVSAYEVTLPANRGDIERLIENVIAGTVDVVTFLSISAVQNFFAVAANMDRVDELKEGLHRVTVIAIGPVTTKALKEEGIEPVVPERFSAVDLVGAIESYLMEKG